MSRALRHYAVRGSIARSRPARRALLIGGALFLLLLAASTTVATFGSSNLANAAVQRARSFLEIIHQRSPGRRTEAHLALTKHKAIAHLHQRALPKVRMPSAIPPLGALPPAIPPLGALPPALIDLVAPPVPIKFAGLDLPPIPILEQGTPPGAPFIPTPGLIVPPSIPQTPPTVPQSALPEPGTWATFLLGFGLVGWQLRRRPNRRRVVAS
jgi:hypothetical protein